MGSMGGGLESARRRPGVRPKHADSTGLERHLGEEAGGEPDSTSAGRRALPTAPGKDLLRVCAGW